MVITVTFSSHNNCSIKNIHTTLIDTWYAVTVITVIFSSYNNYSID